MLRNALNSLKCNRNFQIKLIKFEYRVACKTIQLIEASLLPQSLIQSFQKETLNYGETVSTEKQEKV